MKKSFRERARIAIKQRKNWVFDVAAEYGQIFDNVRHMQWFEKVCAEKLEEESTLL